MLANQAHWPTYLHSLSCLSTNCFSFFFFFFLQTFYFYFIKKDFVLAEKGAVILLDNSKIPNVIDYSTMADKTGICIHKT